MTKAKEPKVLQQRTELDRIVAKLRAVLRRESTNVIEAGNLLIESRKHVERGEWQAWLTENFDLSLRTAQNYYSAAEYVARAKEQSATVADWPNLSPSVLYHLAAGHFSEPVEAAILAASRKGRVDENAMWAICEKLAPPDENDADDDDDQGDDDQGDGEGDGDDAEAAEDPEITAIFDNPPKPPEGSTENLAPTDYALRDFDQAVGALKRLMTKRAAQFAGSTHSVNDLESVEGFLRAVTKAKATPKALAERKEAAE